MKIEENIRLLVIAQSMWIYIMDLHHKLAKQAKHAFDSIEVTDSNHIFALPCGLFEQL